MSMSIRPSYWPGSVRRRLPGEYGRRLARQRLLGQVAGLAGRLVGRARGDLQYQLAEATRQLTADLRRRHAGSADRLAAALSRARLIRAAAADSRDQQLAELAERERVLRALLGRLAAEASGSEAPGRRRSQRDCSDKRELRSRRNVRYKGPTGDEARHQPRTSVPLMASTTVTGRPAWEESSVIGEVTEPPGKDRAGGLQAGSGGARPRRAST